MIRITGGQARGRRLKVTDAGKVRPTTDKVRQALFNVLQHRFDHAPHEMRVLDLFAGAGSLGLEALSRGADSVVLVEKDRRVARQLQENARVVGGASKVVCCAVDRFLAGAAEGAPFELVLLDPPYADGLVDPTLAALASAKWLSPGAVICVEHPQGATLSPPETLRPAFDRRYGDCALSLYTYEPAPAGP